MLTPALIRLTADTRPERMTIMRLPPAAGQVSKVVATNWVSQSPSWIAKGDKYYSLCMPAGPVVACAPIVATSIMQDIDVGAHAGPDGTAVTTFQFDPRTKQPLKRLVYAVNYFLARLEKKAAHFNRMAVMYAQILGDGDGDFGSWEANVFGAAADGNEAGDGCDGVCSYPSGRDNGDGDPCVDSQGNAICQVSGTGERPALKEPASMCDLLPAFCSPGQVPAISPGPWSDELLRLKAIDQCYNQAHAMASTCREMKGGDATPFPTCMRNASVFPMECELNKSEASPSAGSARTWQ